MIVNNREGEINGPFIILHHDERSKIVAIDQDSVIKRYLTSQIRPFLIKTSMFDDSIIDRKIEDRHDKTYKEPYERELGG